MRKYGVIGLGQVGATVAYTLVQQGIVDELVLIDKNEALATAQKLDLDDASARLSSTTKIILNDYSALADAEVLIVASGNIAAIDMNSSKGRFGEYDSNQAIVRDIAPKIVASGFKGILIDIMNPCDVMTDYLQRMTGFPRNRVLRDRDVLGHGPDAEVRGSSRRDQREKRGRLRLWRTRELPVRGVVNGECERPTN